MSINQVCESCGREWNDPDSPIIDLCPHCEARAEAESFVPSTPVPGYGEACYPTFRAAYEAGAVIELPSGAGFTAAPAELDDLRVLWGGRRIGGEY